MCQKNLNTTNYKHRCYFKRQIIKLNRIFILTISSVQCKTGFAIEIHFRNSKFCLVACTKVTINMRLKDHVNSQTTNKSSEYICAVGYRIFFLLNAHIMYVFKLYNSIDEMSKIISRNSSNYYFCV